MEISPLQEMDQGGGPQPTWGGASGSPRQVFRPSLLPACLLQKLESYSLKCVVDSRVPGLSPHHLPHPLPHPLLTWMDVCIG